MRSHRICRKPVPRQAPKRLRAMGRAKEFSFSTEQIRTHLFLHGGISHLHFWAKKGRMGTKVVLNWYTCGLFRIENKIQSEISLDITIFRAVAFKGLRGYLLDRW